MTAHAWTLANRPVGAPKKSDFEWTEVQPGEAGKGEVRAETLYLSLDPYMRGRMSEGQSYAEPVPIGGVMEGETIAQVAESNHPDYRTGDVVSGRGGWAAAWVLPGDQLRKLPETPFPLSYHLGMIGMPGLTAYTGLTRIGEPKEGETVVVAAASGAVGSVVGQIAKRLGCRAVGIAGGREKCAFVTDELGFDACLDHKAGGLSAALKDACPDGIDIYFENVGGKVWEAVLPRLNDFARVPVCGLIAGYNAKSREELQSDVMMADLMRLTLTKRFRIEGFIVSDYWAETMPDFQRDMAKWQAERPFTYREDVTEGLEGAPEAFMALLEGGNFGKAIVKIGD